MLKKERLNIILNKFVAIFILVMLIMNSSISFVHAETATARKKRLEKEIKEAEADKKYVEEEITSNVLAINDFEIQIEERKLEIEKLGKEIEKTQEEVGTISEDLNKQEEDYAKQEVLVKKRLTFMYEQGEYSTWEILLKSDGLMDFLSNYYMLQELSAIDNEILSESSKNKRKIEILKKELDSKEKILKEAQDRVKASQVAQQNLMKLKQEKVDKLSAKEKNLVSSISRLKQQYKEAEAQIAREMASSATSKVFIGHPDGKYHWPLPMSSNYMSTKYGDGPAQGYYWTENPWGHLAIDVADAAGTPIYASNAGIVRVAGSYGGYGNTVVIDHGAGVFTRYAHGRKILVSKNQSVKRGQKIMEMGSTGLSESDHLHFDFFVGGYNTGGYFESNRVNPLEYVTRPVPLLYRPGRSHSHLNEDIY